MERTFSFNEDESPKTPSILLQQTHHYNFVCETADDDFVFDVLKMMKKDDNDKEAQKITLTTEREHRISLMPDRTLLLDVAFFQMKPEHHPFQALPKSETSNFWFLVLKSAPVRVDPKVIFQNPSVKTNFFLDYPYAGKAFYHLQTFNLLSSKELLELLRISDDHVLDIYPHNDIWQAIDCPIPSPESYYR